jgi:hypothetical protein
MVCGSGKPIVKVISGQEGTNDHTPADLRPSRYRACAFKPMLSGPGNPIVNMIRSQSNRIWNSLMFTIIVCSWPVASADVEPTGTQPPAAPPGPSASIGPADPGIPAK